MRKGSRWIPIAAGTVGTIIGVIGIFISLYAVEVRRALDYTFSRFVAEASTIVVAVFAGCGLTFLVSRWMFTRERPAVVLRRTLDIRVNAVEGDIPDDDAVVGRTLKYIERYRPSEELVICIHGLGLDADDFRPFLNEGPHHAVALTLFGFNAEERDDERYQPISLVTHAELASYAIRSFADQYPDKRLVVVGFSLGADLFMLISERWAKGETRPQIHAALLLDPNVNRSSTNISSAIARLDAKRPLYELRRLMDHTGTLIEFRNMCSYLYKITSKNLHQIRRYASEIVDYWDDTPDFDQFLDRLGAVASVTDRLQVIFSFHYESHFNSALRAVRARHMESTSMECARHDHFELMAPELLTEKLREVLN